MLTVVAVLEAKPGKEQELERTLMELVPPTRQEAGCINYDLHRSRDDSRMFMFYENWVDRKSLDAHLATPHLTAFKEKAADLLAGPLEITLYEMISEPR